jgi:hypothetical protein
LELLDLDQQLSLLPVVVVEEQKIPILVVVLVVMVEVVMLQELDRELMEPQTLVEVVVEHQYIILQHQFLVLVVPVLSSLHILPK